MLSWITAKFREFFLYPFTSGLVANAVGLNKFKFILFWILKAFYISRISCPSVLLQFREAKFVFSCGIEIVIFDDIFLRKVYERAPGFSPCENTIIVDIGANVGIYSVYAAYNNPAAKIFAVEPVPVIRKRLERNIVLNKVSGSVKIIPLAFWDSDCQLFFDVYKYFPQTRANFQRKGCAVSAITLDTFVNRYAIQTIDLLKLDAEFAEDNILKGGEGLALSLISKIVLEYHSEDKKICVEELLFKHGFKKVLQFERILYFMKERKP
ncbi:MAG: FkbM family methyltransferase, partial [Candidatus Omnitrophica bacterium]|nr:FkbM family methyltransferase [Candidatus Omnitrophota bacterium]